MYPTHSLLATVVWLLILALDVWAIFSVLMGSTAPERKLGWVLVILLLPVLGLFLYSLIGRSKRDAILA